MCFKTLTLYETYIHIFGYSYTSIYIKSNFKMLSFKNINNMLCYNHLRLIIELIILICISTHT